MNGAWDFFAEILTEMWYVVPNMPKWDSYYSVSASKLTMEPIKWPDDGNITTLSIISHFACANTMEMKNFPLTRRFLMEKFMPLINEIKSTSFAQDLEVEIATSLMYIAKADRYSFSGVDTKKALV